MIKKLCLTKHIKSLHEGSLAKEIMETQLKFQFPELVSESKQIINDLKLPNILNNDINKQYSKLKWKKLVKEEVWKKCETDLREEIKKLEKLVESKMSDEMFETKSYLKNMTLENARVKFKIRTEMLNLKFNYKHMPQNEKTLWQCDSCQSSIETQSHIMWCPAYRELRVGKDINDDNDLIEYVKR